MLNVFTKQKMWIKILYFLILSSLVSLLNADNNIISRRWDQIEQQSGNKKIAHLSLLNKITAKSQYFNVPVNESIVFGNLEVFVDKCWSSPLPERHDYIFIRVIEYRSDDDENLVFKGWILSDNPSISTMVHPVYEVFAIGCLD